MLPCCLTSNLEVPLWVARLEEDAMHMNKRERRANLCRGTPNATPEDPQTGLESIPRLIAPEWRVKYLQGGILSFFSNLIVFGSLIYPVHSLSNHR